MFTSFVFQAEFDEAIPMIAPMMHCICLAWVNSQYYSTPARIIVLLQELCNLFIQQVRIDDSYYKL